MKVCLIQYTLGQNTNVKKLPVGQNKRFRKCPLFLSQALTFFLCNSYMS